MGTKIKDLATGSHHGDDQAEGHREAGDEYQPQQVVAQGDQHVAAGQREGVIVQADESL